MIFGFSRTCRSVSTVKCNGTVRQHTPMKWNCLSNAFTILSAALKAQSKATADASLTAIFPLSPSSGISGKAVFKSQSGYLNPVNGRVNRYNTGESKVDTP